MVYPPESKYKTYKMLLNLEIQPDHSLKARSPDMVLIYENKKCSHIANFAVLTDHLARMSKLSK